MEWNSWRQEPQESRMMRILHGLWQESKTGLEKGEATILPTAGNFKGQALTNAIVFTDTFAVVAGELALLTRNARNRKPAPLTH
jgi:hypothetical protein